MMAKFSLFFLIMVMFFSIGCFGESEIEVDTMIQDMDGIPLPFIHHAFKTHGAYFGVIAKSSDSYVFHLYDSSGYEITRSDKGMSITPFYMYMTDSVIVLWEMIYEGRYKMLSLDYEGRVRFGPITTSSALYASPGGTYYFGINDFLEGNSRPSLYDSAGNKIVVFRMKTGYWGFTPIDDSTILLQDGPELKILEFPSLNIIRIINIDGIHPINGPMRTMISENREYYAFNSRDEFIVCDLANDNIYRIPNNTGHGQHALALSSDGTYFAVFEYGRGITASIYKKDSDIYSPVIFRKSLPLIEPTELIIDNPKTMGSTCIVKMEFFSVRDVRAQSFIMDFANEENAIKDGIAVMGNAVAVAFEQSGNTVEILNYVIDKNEANKIKRQHLKSTRVANNEIK